MGFNSAFKGLNKSIMSECLVRSMTDEAPVWSKALPCGICGEQSGNGTGFTQSILAFHCQYHSTNDPYSHLIHLPTMPHNLATNTNIRQNSLSLCLSLVSLCLSLSGSNIISLITLQLYLAFYFHLSFTDTSMVNLSVLQSVLFSYLMATVYY